MYVTQPDDVLRTAFLLREVPEAELQVIADSLDTVSFAAGELITHEGELGSEWFLIRSGEAGVISRDLTGQEVTLAVLGPGQTIGEIALVRTVPRTATVRALQPVQTYRLDRDAFASISDRCPVFADRVHRHVERLLRHSFLRKASPFADLPDRALRRLAVQMGSRACRSGEVVVQEGEPGDRFFLVRSGRLEVLKAGRRIAVLEEGDFFGETALLTGVPRTATVRCLQDTELLFLERRDFAAVVGEHPGLREQFAAVLQVRFHAASDQPLMAPDMLTTIMPFLDGRGRWRYWGLLLGGVALFAPLALFATLLQSRPLGYVAVLAGALLGPAVYVHYLSRSRVLLGWPAVLAVGLALAAAVGAPLALGLHGMLRGPVAAALAAALLVAAVAEPAKLLGLLWLMRRRAARFEMDGLIHGALVGMAFAAGQGALFTLGSPDFPARMDAAGWLGVLLAPFTHGTWTAMAGAAIWRSRDGNPWWDRRAAGTLASAVVLHTLWLWQPVPYPYDLLWIVAVAFLGVLYLRAMVQQAITRYLRVAAGWTPGLSDAIGDRPALRCRGCGLPAAPGARYCPHCGLALKTGRKN